MNLDYLNNLYKTCKVNTLFGRYITNSHLEDFIKTIPHQLVDTLGYSVENKPIYGIKIGSGTTKVLLWSQMHGNESTTTKALLDLISVLIAGENDVLSILNDLTLFMIPILNPDGAKYYTRLNANEVDLNRDAQDLSQPESRVLRQVFDDIKPDYCFNLHGQRTIYNISNTNVSAILAFLSPAQDATCSLTTNRKKAMSIISEVNKTIQTEIPNAVARYDDSFNLNCVGDTFQSLGVPTLLYEAGHYPKDYNREEVRRLIFIAIFKGLLLICEGVDANNYEDYFLIPENEKRFHDIIITNARIKSDSQELFDIVIQYKEVLKDKKVEFSPEVVEISDVKKFFGHKVIDAKGGLVKTVENLSLEVPYENDFVLINNEKISLLPSFF